MIRLPEFICTDVFWGRFLKICLHSDRYISQRVDESVIFPFGSDISLSDAVFIFSSSSFSSLKLRVKPNFENGMTLIFLKEWSIYIPQFILRNFASEDGTITYYDKEGINKATLFNDVLAYKI